MEQLKHSKNSRHLYHFGICESLALKGERPQRSYDPLRASLRAIWYGSVFVTVLGNWLGEVRLFKPLLKR